MVFGKECDSVDWNGNVEYEWCEGFCLKEFSFEECKVDWLYVVGVICLVEGELYKIDCYKE